MLRVIALLLLIASGVSLQAQDNQSGEILVTVMDPVGSTPVRNATVELLKGDSSFLKAVLTDSTGLARFSNLKAGFFICRIKSRGVKVEHSALLDLRNKNVISTTLHYKPEFSVLENVKVNSRKPLVQHFADRTVINVEASVVNTGATVMEVLERSPGVIVDRDGNISLKGKSSVLVMIDGKPTQLPAADLQNLLSGMNASQVETIELIENPGAKYDAAGNGGIINIKTKKNRQRGFNGTLSTSYGQGMYPKNNNSLVLNYRNGKFNFFSNYSVNYNHWLLNVYALRTYYKPDGSISSQFDQPDFTDGQTTSHTLRSGMDYFLNKSWTLGTAVTGTWLKRHSENENESYWLNASGQEDSSILTESISDGRFKQKGINLNTHYTIDANREFSADMDVIDYNIRGSQYFINSLGDPPVVTDESKGTIPTDIRINSYKADYTERRENAVFEVGWKSSFVKTENEAKYEVVQSGQWVNDLGKTNHFIYSENIHALYGSLQHKKNKLELQLGLRYELTGYKAKQLGNAIAKDSSFNRKYQSLFPTFFLNYKADTNHSFILRAGRRIDRPAFQKLNPFVFIINKYTFYRGNPYFRPQYTWNLEAVYMYRDKFTFSANYSRTSDYFSQIFLSDSNTGIIIYTEGNVGKMQSYGCSANLTLSPSSWWTLTAQGTFIHKKIEGFLWRAYTANINQGNFSLNNQLKFKKGWGMELSGVYITRNQNDLQEVLDPTGQLSAGISKQILDTRGTLRLSFRDMFYTQAMQGLTHFETVTEYFKLQRDTRVLNLGFTYRFGKTFKVNRRNTGGASEEINRVGTGN